MSIVWHNGLGISCPRLVIFLMVKLFCSTQQPYLASTYDVVPLCVKYLYGIVSVSHNSAVHIQSRQSFNHERDDAGKAGLVGGTRKQMSISRILDFSGICLETNASHSHFGEIGFAVWCPEEHEATDDQSLRFTSKQLKSISFFKKMGHSQPLFLYFRLFYCTIGK